MRFESTRLDGAVIVELERSADERGWFARSFCEVEFGNAGLPTRFPQSNLSANTRAGTLRGMHINVTGHAESKLVRCVRGAIWDVIVDLRPGSATWAEWIAVELSAGNGRALFVPEGFAHGFLTLEDDSDVHYQMGRAFEPGFDVGFRWNDPQFAIDWPITPTAMSERDRTYPDFDPSILER